MKRYEGSRRNGYTCVTSNGHPLDPRLDLRNHSPDGFEWGYGGSGPAQLALALLSDHFGDPAKALILYQDFKFGVVAELPYESWTLTSADIDQAVGAIVAQSSAKGAQCAGPLMTAVTRPT